ncbi:SAV_2336 N-terminal domain-related protein [Actinacidiphila sp. DG2A-62]|uniref:SAV_2336 N-terminal domain-related protein n=1 Tax=Actinacidiphila sp. DG2A-62 TaxID=3108821 RepID=UPI002DBDC17D|nr:SAV_2336 N-terminal domain-related protein [Actinacidiphila sp. DG2A-62]MEC3997492.1 SAV_2336 N-terminal domain-related protein [Actinacidiphila sp. DG2A-62]
MPPLPGPDRPGPPASPGSPAPAEAGPEAGAEADAAARSDARAGDAAPDAGADDGPAGGTRRGTVEGLRDALSGLLRGSASDGAVTAEDLADVLWVARLAGLDRGPGGAGTGSGAEAGTAGAEVPPGSAPRPGGEAPEDAAGDAPAPSRSPGTGSQARPGAGPEPVAPPPDAAEPRVGLHPYAAALPAGPHLGGTAGRGATGSAAGGGAGGGAGAAVHAVRVPQPPALSGALDLARALRPLRQSVEAPGAPLLDEDATAQASGEAGRGRLVPVWRPPVRRRFSVDLLVDTGATMAVWHRLGAELCTLLERHGAFADVRCWSLDTDAAVPRLAPFRRAHRRATAPGAQRSPRPGGRGARWAGALEDAAGRRVLLVLTDGVGPAWYGSALPEFLARVAGERPAAALQVLPRRLWHRTALRTVPVELRMPDPARPVPAVRTDAALPGRPAPRSVRWLPVMEVDGAWLAPWAELVAGRAPGWSPMLAAPVRGVPVRRRAVAGATPEAPPRTRRNASRGSAPALPRTPSGSRATSRRRR